MPTKKCECGALDKCPTPFTCSAFKNEYAHKKNSLLGDVFSALLGLFFALAVVGALTLILLYVELKNFIF